MKTRDELCQLFPVAVEIPEEYRCLSQIHQRSYLVDGERKTWNGAVHTVLPPVCIRDSDGIPKPRPLLRDER